MVLFVDDAQVVMMCWGPVLTNQPIPAPWRSIWSLICDFTPTIDPIMRYADINPVKLRTKHIVPE